MNDLIDHLPIYLGRIVSRYANDDEGRRLSFQIARFENVHADTTTLRHTRIQWHSAAIGTTGRTMIFYVMTETADRARIIAAQRSDVSLWCTTVVLRHDSGFVGFNDDGGTPAVRALVHDTIVLEQANSPVWTSMPAPQISIQAMRSAVRTAATLTSPRPALIGELEAVSRNNARAKQNTILARHRKPLLPLTPTMFDAWVTADGKVHAMNAAWIAASCDLFVMWSSSEWGYYAQVLSDSAEKALSRISQAAQDVQATMKQVATASELPCW